MKGFTGKIDGRGFTHYYLKDKKEFNDIIELKKEEIQSRISVYKIRIKDCADVLSLPYDQVPTLDFNENTE